MKYHALFVIFGKVAKFEIVFSCKLSVGGGGGWGGVGGGAFNIIIYQLGHENWVKPSSIFY